MIWEGNSEIAWHLGRNAWVRDYRVKCVRVGRFGLMYVYIYA